MPLYMHEAAREGAIEISLTDAERNARVELAVAAERLGEVVHLR